MTGVAARRVREVRLTADSDALVQRGAIVLEDALHTATFPEGNGARLFLVRTLDVGTIHPDRSAASLSLVVESQMQRVALRGVYADDPAAEAADVVFFHDSIDAVTKLALRVARAQNTSAWFWPLAVSRWRPDLTRHESGHVLICEAMRGEGGVYGAASMLRGLRDAGALDSLLAALEPAHGSELLGAAGWVRSIPARSRHSRRDAPRGASPTRSTANAMDVEGVKDIDGFIGHGDLAPWLVTLDRWVNEWGVDDDRSIWLTGTVLVGLEPGLTLDATLPLHSTELASALTDGHADRLMRYEAPAGGGPAAVRATPLPVGAGVPGNDTTARELPGVVTEFGGLFFMLNVMERLDVSAFLVDHPRFFEHGLVERLLRSLCGRVDAEDRDRVYSVIPLPVEREPLWPGEFVMPVAWREQMCDQEPWMICDAEPGPEVRVVRDSTGRLTLALWQGKRPRRLQELAGDVVLEEGDIVALGRADAATVAVDSWAAAIDLWCQRAVDLGLEDLVVRPARLTITPTHLDVGFRLSQADIRVRRAGLDNDPGWVPWFGRIVRFHYGEDLGVDDE